MKRLLFVLALVAVFASGCGNTAVRQPDIKGYKIGGISDIGFGQGSARATIEVDLEIDNPGKLDYSINSLKATIYGKNAVKEADAVLKEKATAPAGTSGYVPVFLDLSFTNPLAVLSAGILDEGGFNAANHTADIDATVQVGVFTKNIQKTGIPLADIIEALKVAGAIKGQLK